LPPSSRSHGLLSRPPTPGDLDDAAADFANTPLFSRARYSLHYGRTSTASCSSGVEVVAQKNDVLITGLALTAIATFVDSRRAQQTPLFSPPRSDGTPNLSGVKYTCRPLIVPTIGSRPTVAAR